MHKPTYQARFSNLFQETLWAWAPMTVQFEYLTDLPPLQLIANVNLVPFVGDDCVSINVEDDYWDIPGGTVEPGETYLETLRRELLEEAGAEMHSFKLMGAWFCRSHNTKPYRPHLPHPNFYRLVGYGQVEIVGAPGNPIDGEQVNKVEAMPVEQAVQHFLRQDRPDLAELYQFAALLREGKT